MPRIILICLTSLILTGCAITSHQTTPSSLGKPSSLAAMEAVVDLPGPVSVDTINSADWEVPIAGILDMNDPQVKAARLNDHLEPIHIFMHVLHHPDRGYFLVDSGISRVFLDHPQQYGVNALISMEFHPERIRLRQDTASVTKRLPTPVQGIFLTHLHVDHISGLPDIPTNVPLYVGKNETGPRRFSYMFTLDMINKLLEQHASLKTWPFPDDNGGGFHGIVDIFGDGTVWALSVPGHTTGSTAYLVRTPNGPVLLTGDVSHTRWGWDHGVPPGDFTDNIDNNRKSLLALKALVERHPKIRVRLGHQY